MISHFSIEIFQFVKIFEREVSKKSWKSLDYVEKSWKFLINLESLDKSRQSRFVSTIWINISTKINLDQKILILKISTEKKKVDLKVMDNLDTSQKLVSTRRTFSISISIGLNCRDPQGYTFQYLLRPINNYLLNNWVDIFYQLFEKALIVHQYN